MPTRRGSGAGGEHPSMPRSDNIYELPADLPVPVGDGACATLSGRRLPSVPLMSTAGRMVDLAGRDGRTIVYCYPWTGRPDQELPKGWNEIPGARGCTPGACGFWDDSAALRALGASVCSLSTQTTEYQREVAERLHLPFGLLSDAHLAFTTGLQLPTFNIDGMTLIKRLTLIVLNGQIEKIFYPVFPPDTHAEHVEQWLAQSARPRSAE